WAIFGMMIIAAGVHRRRPGAMSALARARITPEQLVIFTNVFVLIFQVAAVAARQFLIALGHVWEGGTPPCGIPYSAGIYTPTKGGPSRVPGGSHSRPFRTARPFLIP